MWGMRVFTYSMPELPTAASIVPWDRGKEIESHYLTRPPWSAWIFGHACEAIACPKTTPVLRCSHRTSFFGQWQFVLLEMVAQWPFLGRSTLINDYLDTTVLRRPLSLQRICAFRFLTSSFIDVHYMPAGRWQSFEQPLEETIFLFP